MNDAEQNSLIIHAIDSIETLYASYLPFVKNGALFISNPVVYSMGELVQLRVTIPSHHELWAFSGRVVWINYEKQNHRPVGFAVQISDDKIGKNLKTEIERLLAGISESNLPTYTM